MSTPEAGRHQRRQEVNGDPKLEPRAVHTGRGFDSESTAT
jgi:hypothetical protein